MNKPRMDEFYKVRENNVESLTVTETNFLEDETYTNKWVYFYSKDSIINGKLFKDEELKSTFKYTINKNRELTESQVLFYHKQKVNDRLHVKYILSDSVMILKLLDEKLEVYRRMIVEMDSLKSPIKITSLNNDEIEAEETAEYNYNLNTFKYKVYNRYNKLVLDKIEHYNHNFIIGKNELGDVVEMIWPLSRDKSVIRFDYKYDQKNNWIKRVKKIIKNNKEVITTIVRRSIKYKK
ncbi:hypothetical protein [Flavobacterium aurantiibacter]|uniref:Uncharacterized protein n=1 Tax=Flavobacterium aurantiibacter TaxID=2023067 RepID=A0A256A1E7_9FLAO|nr:hypothetical protein [Flavobacterium aurantiibacter]OYQ47459.1 hypothetical protein CHX27_02950 [Flavobacterium aurantiibacter]